MRRRNSFLVRVMYVTGVSDSLSSKCSSLIDSLRLGLCFLGETMSDSNGFEPLSLLMATFGLILLFRFRARGISDPEGSDSLSSDIWIIALDFRLIFFFGLRVGEDDVE